MGTHLSPPQKGSGAATPIFGPCPLWPNGWMDPDGTWHGGGLGPDHIVLDEYPALLPPPKKRGGGASQFSAHVCYGQTPEWTKMPLGMEVGLGPGHIVLGGGRGTSFPQNRKGHSNPPVLGPSLLWPNGWMDEDATCYGGRSRPKPHWVRWGPSLPT